MTDAVHAVILARPRGGGPTGDIAPPPHLHAARVGAGLLFLAALLLLAHAYRRLRDRARAEEANAFLREEFERLERPSVREAGDAKEPDSPPRESRCDAPRGPGRALHRRRRRPDRPR